MAESPHQAQGTELLTQYQRRLRVFLRALVGERGEVEDLLQEVNLWVWTHAEEFEPGTDFGAWAFRVAHYHVLTYRKRMARQKLRFGDGLLEKVAEDARAEA